MKKIIMIVALISLGSLVEARTGKRAPEVLKNSGQQVGGAFQTPTAKVNNNIRGILKTNVTVQFANKAAALNANQALVKAKKLGVEDALAGAIVQAKTFPAVEKANFNEFLTKLANPANDNDPNLKKLLKEVDKNCKIAA